MGSCFCPGSILYCYKKVFKNKENIDVEIEFPFNTTLNFEGHKSCLLKSEASLLVHKTFFIFIIFTLGKIGQKVYAMKYIHP